jgi:WD40 repeat protein
MIKVSDAEKGTELVTLKSRGPALRLGWSPDSRRLAVGSGDSTMKVWDPVHRRELLSLNNISSPGKTLAWSPDGERLASGVGRIAKEWDAANGKELLTLTGHTDDVESVAWEPNGRRLASGSRDGTVKLWDGRTGKELMTLNGHYGPIVSVAWSPDGKRLASASEDRTIQVYALDIHDLMALARQRVTTHPSEEGCKKYFGVDQCPSVPGL